MVLVRGIRARRWGEDGYLISTPCGSFWGVDVGGFRLGEDAAFGVVVLIEWIGKHEEEHIRQVMEGKHATFVLALTRDEVEEWLQKEQTVQNRRNPRRTEDLEILN